MNRVNNIMATVRVDLTLASIYAANVLILSALLLSTRDLVGFISLATIKPLLALALVII